MKPSLFLLMFLLPLIFATAAEVRPGDSMESVRAALGPPRGKLEAGGRVVFHYVRGEIELHSGIVTRVALRTEEEQADLETRRTAEVARVRDEQEIRRARLTAEGDATKARKLADPLFQSASPAIQVAFWEDFSRRYADVPCAEQLQTARARLAEQTAAERLRADQSARMAELEARLAEVEAERTNYTAYRSVGQGLYPPYPVYRGRRPFNPGKIEYHFFESPLPYATSPGMPPMQPTFRLDPMTPNKHRPSENYPRYRSGAGDRQDRDFSGHRSYLPDSGRY